jgi:hypothetical protein
MPLSNSGFSASGTVIQRNAGNKQATGRRSVQCQLVIGRPVEVRYSRWVLQTHTRLQEVPSTCDSERLAGWRLCEPVNHVPSALRKRPATAARGIFTVRGSVVARLGDS